MKASFAGVIAIALTATLFAQAGPGRGTQGSESAQVQRVRVAIGHGNVAEARRLAEAIPAGAGRDLGSALVDIFEGKDDAARVKLEPLANVNRLGDAALELGLLELRRGQRRQGEARLEPIVSNRTFAGPEDYFRLARAARGAREFMLANDAYNEIAKAKLPRADIYAERGDVWYQRHRPGDAVIEYRTALEADPAWVPALIGLARALAQENPKAAAQAGAEAEKLAPNHPDLWLFKAERRLEQEDLPAAVEALDRVAQSRPGTVDEAAFRAALAYRQGDTPAMNAAIERAAAIDPTSALPHRRIGEQAADMFRSVEAAEWARKATVKDPSDGFAFFDLGLYLFRSGDEPGARTALERSFQLDNSNRVTKNILDVMDRIDTFETVTVGDFIFKFEKEDAAVLRTYAIPLAEEATKTFGTRYGFKPEGPILVEIFSVHDEFAIRTMGLPGLVGALGACFGKVVAMDSPRARPPGTFSWQATLWHELAHVYTLQMSNYRVPRWLTEGISVYEEYKRNPAWGRELALEFAVQLSEGETFGVKKLPDAFKRPETLSLAYFEASLLTEHLVELNGEAGLRTLLNAYAAGDKDPEAFAKAFGRSVDAVETSFKTFVDQRYGSLARAMAPPKGPIPNDTPALRALAAQSPGSFQVQMALGAALYKAGDMAGAKQALERAAELAPQATGPGSPRALLASIAEKEGDNTRARRELRRLLTFDHENVAAARKLADLSGDAPANADDRDFALRLVADLDPFDADTHVNLGRRLLAKNNLQPALVEFQAALALGPSNLAEAHTDVGETLFKIGRKDEARRHVLLALQQAPTFARAQDILLAILGRN
jgi:tetratricopeptide (TPR) repeat protein